MSDFLLIIPSGWTQLDWQFITNHSDLSLQVTLEWISTTSWSSIEYALKSIDAIPQTSSVLNAKLFDDTFFMVLLG